MRIVRRIALWVGIVLVVMMIVLLVRLDSAGVFAVVPSGFSSGNWAKIHKGMSKDEAMEKVAMVVEGVYSAKAAKNKETPITIQS